VGVEPHAGSSSVYTDFESGPVAVTGITPSTSSCLAVRPGGAQHSPGTAVLAGTAGLRAWVPGSLGRAVDESTVLKPDVVITVARPVTGGASCARRIVGAQRNASFSEGFRKLLRRHALTGTLAQDVLHGAGARAATHRTVNWFLAPSGTSIVIVGDGITDNAVESLDRVVKLVTAAHKRRASFKKCAVLVHGRAG
jgi:hypothetical protein